MLFGADEGADPETGGARAADDTPDDEPTRKVRGRLRHHSSTPGGGVSRRDPTIRPGVSRKWQRMPGAATFKPPSRERSSGWHPRSRLRRPPAPQPRLDAGSARARPYKIAEPDGQTKQLLAVTIMVVNRRKETIRRFAEVIFTFQVRLEVRCQKGPHPRTDLTGRRSSDLDAALADLHYPDVADYARGSNALAGWHADEDGRVRYVSSSTSRRRRFANGRC
jgi:hypothetical protein